MQQEGTRPVDEFYEQRLARARALPEAARSADVRQWLRQHDELEAALAALPEVPASASAQRPLAEPLGGDAALAALLRYIVAAFCDSEKDPDHPMATLERLAAQLPPYFRAWYDDAGAQVRCNSSEVSSHVPGPCTLASTILENFSLKVFFENFLFLRKHFFCNCLPQFMLVGEPALVEVLERGSLAADDADLKALARLMLVPIVSCGPATKASSHAAAGRHVPFPAPACLPARLPSTAARLTPLICLPPS